MGMVTDPKKKKKRVIWAIVAVVVIVPGIIFGGPIINAFMDGYRGGFFDAAKQHRYSATTMENLKALYQAVALYNESEGMLPEASGWMDAAKTYVRTNDLKKGEEMKKFINPRFPAGEGVFGYAFNIELSMAYLDEIEDPAQTPMIFESKDTRWNAFGHPADLQPDPELEDGNQAVTADGTAVALKKLLQPNG